MALKKLRAQGCMFQTVMIFCPIKGVPASWSSGNAFGPKAGGLNFKFRAGQI